MDISNLSRQMLEVTCIISCPKHPPTLLYSLQINSYSFPADHRSSLKTCRQGIQISVSGHGKTELLVWLASIDAGHQSHPALEMKWSWAQGQTSKTLVLRRITGHSHGLWLQWEGQLMPLPFWRCDHQGLERDTAWKAICYDALSKSFDLGQTEAIESKMKHSKHMSMNDVTGSLV